MGSLHLLAGGIVGSTPTLDATRTKKKVLDKWHELCYNLIIKDRFKSLKPKGIDTMTNTTSTSKTTKLTKAQKFAIIADLPAVKADPMLTEFIAHEMELLTRKNSSDKKPTAKQEANEIIKAEVLDVLGANPNRLFSVTELLKVVPNLPEDMTNQRMSALVRQMVDAGSVKRTEDKRKAFFSIA